MADPLEAFRKTVGAAAEDLLKGYKPRRYRGDKVVRDVVWGMVNLLPHELALIDSPVFQRLRGVYQTSLALLTYPCSVHSRFEHSIGALAIAEKVVPALNRRADGLVNELDKVELRLAALLHD